MQLVLRTAFEIWARCRDVDMLLAVSLQHGTALMAAKGFVELCPWASWAQCGGALPFHRALGKRFPQGLGAHQCMHAYHPPPAISSACRPQDPARLVCLLPSACSVHYTQNKATAFTADITWWKPRKLGIRARVHKEPPPCWLSPFLWPCCGPHPLAVPRQSGASQSLPAASHRHLLLATPATLLLLLCLSSHYTTFKRQNKLNHSAAWHWNSALVNREQLSKVKILLKSLTTTYLNKPHRFLRDSWNDPCLIQSLTLRTATWFYPPPHHHPFLFFI